MIERAHIERLEQTLQRLESDLQTRGAEVKARTRGVGLLIRIMAAAMGLLALGNLYFVNDLTTEVRLSILSLQEMTGHFREVSDRMDTLTDTVESMDRRVALMPVIRDQVYEIAGHVHRMETDVGGMRGSVRSMDIHLDGLNAGVFDMSRRFHGLNRSVGGMGIDVEQLSRPMP
jgi:hypothetical protein